MNNKIKMWVAYLIVLIVLCGYLVVDVISAKGTCVELGYEYGKPKVFSGSIGCYSIVEYDLVDKEYVRNDED